MHELRAGLGVDLGDPRTEVVAERSRQRVQVGAALQRDRLLLWPPCWLDVDARLPPVTNLQVLTRGNR